MRYVDLHCDSATVCLDRGYSLSNAATHINFEKLKGADCAVQCFAIFTDGEGARERFYKYHDFLSTSVKSQGLTVVDNFHRLISCVRSQKTGVIFAVENLGFTQGNEQEIIALKSKGILMASLVWNNENCFAYPNIVTRGGICDFKARESRGLKNAGRNIAELLSDLKILIDISHLSDGGADEILKNAKAPIVASHSNARAVCDMPRNLCDGQIKKIAECGGVAGINFCKAFLGEGEQFECVLRHVKHMVNVGGEDVVAFGSDFDGIPTVRGLEGCQKMPDLIEYLSGKLGDRLVKKLCSENFARVLKEMQ